MSGARSALITGATGYLGKHLVSLLSEKGVEITCLVRETSNRDGLPSTVKFITKVEEIENVDYFFHLATCYGRNNESDQEIRKVNVEFPTEICHRLDRQAIVFNFSTSLPAKVNIYAQTKFEFSDYMKNLDKFHQFLNLKVEQFYGPGDKTFVGSLLKHLKMNTPSIPLTDGKQKRDFIYIDDVISSIDTLMNHFIDIPLGYSDIAIGSGESHSIREVVELLKELTGSTSELEFGKISYRANEPLHMQADVSLLRDMGWAPKFDLPTGLSKTIES